MHHHLPSEVQRGTALAITIAIKTITLAPKITCVSVMLASRADPRRSHDRLNRVVALFAALRRLVLHAPLADLLPKRQRRQLPPTSNAVRHVLQKSIST